uniref:Protein TIME FOR COFFEE n=1 Tax=Davidia involucrata TaxID=16924 RepID=A0A5B7ASJ5_DAVIN
MDRNREARRASMATANGLSRRRHRSSSVRDSPEEDGPVELHEPARLRDRGVKKDRDRDRDRDRLSRSKRRRGDNRLMHGTNREDGDEDSTEESVNDEEDDDDEEGGGGVSGGAVRMLPPNPAAALSSSMLNHHNQHRKSFPPAAKVFRAAVSWKAADEMIGVSVPRKARSASTKRSHESWISGNGVGGDQIHRQPSTSPVRPNLASTSTTPSPAPISPSSSNASLRKKMKPNGPKARPPKSSSKSSSSNPEELEIEIAEVLYGLMTQSQVPSKKEIMANDSAKFDSRDTNNKSSSDAKSRVSSPISNSQSTGPHQSVMVAQNSSSSTAPLLAVAPKRKRPRQVSDNLGSFTVRSSPISSTTKVEIHQPPKAEISSPNLEKTSGSGAENGGVPYNLANSTAVPPSSEPPPESAKPEGRESKPLPEEAGESRDVVPTKGEVTSPKKESPAFRVDDDCEDVTATKVSSTISEIESQREEKFQIDLMAPPPQLRPSPEREGEIDYVASAADLKPVVSNLDAEMRLVTKDEKAAKIGKEDVEPEEKAAKLMVEEAESQKSVVNKERNIDLQLDLEKPDRENCTGSASGNKLHQHVPKQQQQQPAKVKKEEPHTEKTVQPSLPLPMSVASWPGGLPPMGYMAPLQGVVSMDGSTVSSTPLQPLFSQPRPKRCATHRYIARNIHNLQQFMKMNPFWPAAAGSASLFGAKPCNLNVVPSAELHGNIAGRTLNSVQEKGQSLAIFPGHTGTDKGSQAAHIADAAQRKQQILLQQALPHGVPPNNMLHGPTFIFPMSQHQAAAAAAVSVRPGSAKSPTITGSVASSNASSSASVSASATAAAAATAVSFNYPNMAANETQYLAILQNNAYPFPIPAVGAPPTYRGTHAQAMPYFNGSFYSSQMIHPSQLQHQHQHQHQHQQQPPTQQQQMQQGYPNTSISSGSSSSQKHLQSQQQRQQGSSANGGSGNGNLNSFSSPKNRPSQSPQQHQQANQHIPPLHQARHLETEVGGEDSPSTADSRVSRATMSVYGQNFAMPIHPQNFALMTPPSVLAGTSGGGNQSEKKQQPQQQGLKAGVEPLQPQTFAMSFASINGTTRAPCFDISSMAQNHAILQSLPEATRQSYHNQFMAAAAQVAQQKKNFRVSEEGKTGGGDSSNVDEEKKGLAGKASATVGQSIAFSRPDSTDASVSTITGNTVIDNSARTLNIVSVPPRTSRSAMPNAMGAVNAPNSQLQAQLQHQQQQQFIQLQKHQQHQQQQQLAAAAAAARSKTPATSNGSVYTDHLTSSSVAGKFQNALCGFPQNMVQSGSSSPAQSPQWKNSIKTTTNSQVPSSLASSTLKNLPQQQVRTQQSHTQISFGANPKSSQGQQVPSSNQSQSPPMVIGSPTTSSISKGAGGSPRTTTSTSTGNKAAQPCTLSSQQTKNSPSAPSRKSSPVGGRNVPSILGNSSSSTGTKSQMQKQALQQPQLFFSNAYMQAQAPHSTSTSSTASATSGYYLQRRCPEQPQGSSATGMLSLGTSDPAKAAAAAVAVAAASNMKGGGFPSQGILQQAQFVPAAGFSYVPAAVQVKPAEQKQPAGKKNRKIKS